MLHAHALEVRHHGEILPDLLVQARLLKLVTQDGVGLAHGLQTVAGDRAQAAHAQTRSREGLTVNHGVRQSQLHAAGADLVLEQLL